MNSLNADIIIMFTFCVYLLELNIRTFYLFLELFNLSRNGSLSSSKNPFTHGGSPTSSFPFPITLENLSDMKDDREKHRASRILKDDVDRPLKLEKSNIILLGSTGSGNVDFKIIDFGKISNSKSVLCEIVFVLFVLHFLV